MINTFRSFIVLRFFYSQNNAILKYYCITLSYHYHKNVSSFNGYIVFSQSFCARPAVPLAYADVRSLLIRRIFPVRS